MSVTTYAAILDHFELILSPAFALSSSVASFVPKRHGRPGISRAFDVFVLECDFLCVFIDLTYFVALVISCVSRMRTCNA